MPARMNVLTGPSMAKDTPRPSRTDLPRRGRAAEKGKEIRCEKPRRIR